MVWCVVQGKGQQTTSDLSQDSLPSDVIKETTDSPATADPVAHDNKPPATSQALPTATPSDIKPEKKKKVHLLLG